MFAPLARYRLYTRVTDYVKLARAVVGGWTDGGSDVSDLERQIQTRLQIKHAVAMPQNRVGVYFAVKLLVGHGRKIVLSPYTLTDVINMVVCAGAVPVFADIDRETCNIAPDSVEALIDDQTDAVMVTHLNGLVCDMDRLGRICNERGVKLIEDAAQAFGARQGDKFTGTFGDAGVFSFGLYKNVTGFYGGMLVTDDDELAQRVRGEMAGLPVQSLGMLLRKALTGALSDLATHPALFKVLTFWVFRYAHLHNIEFLNRQVRIEDNPALKTSVPDHYLCRMSSVQAKIIENQLDLVDQLTASRRRFAKMYHDGLHNIPEVIVPPWRDDTSHIYTYYPIQVADRAALIRHMVLNGRDVAIQHLRNCAELKCFGDYAADVPDAKTTAEDCILLSSYPGYSAADVRANIDAIRSHYGHG